MPTASGNRQEDVSDWLQPFTEGAVDGESGSSSSAGEPISQNTSSTYATKTFEQLNVERQAIYSFIVQRDRKSSMRKES